MVKQATHSGKKAQATLQCACRHAWVLHHHDGEACALLLSVAVSLRTNSAGPLPAYRKPAMMVMGWIFCATSCSASRSSSPASTTTLVVPSPTWGGRSVMPHEGQPAHT
jgi:hypothetical protein